MSATTAVHDATPSTDAAQVELRSIPLSQITVAEGFNPRGEVAEDAELQALAETMRQRGCLQPIRAHAAVDGGYVLIAGERRYRAAALAGLLEIPASVLHAGPGEEQHLELLSEAIIENELRCDLNALQRARGYRAMIDGGLTVRGVAERLGGSSGRRSREQRIKEHLAILSLPEDLQERVAAGEIPLLAVRAMVGLCEIHEDLARAAVIAATPGNDYEEPYSWSEIAENPLASAVNCCEQLPPGVLPTRTAHTLEVFALGEKAKKDLADYEQLTGRPLQEIRFTAEEVEQARALGAVHDAGWLQVIAGQDVADGLAEDHIHRTLKEERARRRETGDTDEAATSDGDTAATAAAPSPDCPLGDPGEERKQVREAREQAARFNEQLGLLAFKHLTRIKVDERVLRILASVDLGRSLRSIAARGGRLTLPGWSTQTQQKNGRTKTTYLESHDAHEKALEFLNGADSAADIAGRTLTLIATAAFADEQAIAQSRRSFYTLTFQGPWAEQADHDLKAILRERIKEGQLPALDEILRTKGEGA
jgi:ParB/RepB/Spo0J family partition protein